MKKILSLLIAVALISSALGQKKKDWSKVTIDRAGDHLMIQLSSDNWGGAPDSIKNRKTGLSRGLNIAVMMNMPFKTDPRWSIAAGIGISHSSIFFKSTNIDLKATSTLLPFSNQDSSDHFKKYKLATTYAEIPVELRYTVDPVNEKKSWKMALGVKVGTMLNAHTKGKTYENKNGGVLNSYTDKISKKSFFNGTRIAATARIGYGNFSLFTAYSITTLLKDVAGPALRPYQIGLCISGL